MSGLSGPIPGVSELPDRVSELLSEVSGHIPGVSDLLNGCPNLCPDYLGVYPEYPGWSPCFCYCVAHPPFPVHLICPVCNVFLFFFKFHQTFLFFCPSLEELFSSFSLCAWWCRTPSVVSVAVQYRRQTVSSQVDLAPTVSSLVCPQISLWFSKNSTRGHAHLCACLDASGHH